MKNNSSKLTKHYLKKILFKNIDFFNIDQKNKDVFIDKLSFELVKNIKIYIPEIVNESVEKAFNKIVEKIIKDITSKYLPEFSINYVDDNLPKIITSIVVPMLVEVKKRYQLY